MGTAVAAVHCAIGLRPCRWMERAEPCERGSPTPGQTTSDRQRRYARQRPSQSDLLTAAILDVGLDRETTDSIAALLSERQIPFVFYTGEELPADMQARWPNCTAVLKPARHTALTAAIARLLDPK